MGKKEESDYKKELTASLDAIRFVAVKCPRCGDEWDAPPNRQTDTCPECAETMRLGSAAAKQMDDNIKQWRDVTPAIFWRDGPLATDINHTDFPKAAWEIVSKWQYKEKGLLISGPTRTGKSRVLFLLLYSLMVEPRQYKTAVLHGGDFRHQLITAYDQSSGTARRLLNDLAGAPLLAWDDFGMDVLGAGPEADLRWLVDQRMQRGLPTLYTTQFESGDALIGRMAGRDRGRVTVWESIMRRIKESTEHIMTTPDKRG